MEGDYLQHFNHPDKLKLQNEIRVFNCDGCMERGWGPRYKCEKCNYHLHKDCALAAASKTHMFFKRCTFNLWLNGSDDTYCIACEKVAVGYVYYCNTNGYYLHPCCAYLPLSLEGEGYVLQLHPSLSAKCGRCGRKDTTWSYRNKDYHYHVSCLNDMTIEKCEKKYLSMIAKNSFSMEITMVPNLQLTRYRDKTSLKDKMKKIAKVIRNLFITSVTGDPTGGAILMKSVL